MMCDVPSFGAYGRYEVSFVFVVCLSVLSCLFSCESLSLVCQYYTTTRLHYDRHGWMDGWMDAVLYSYLSMTYSYCVLTITILSIQVIVS